MLELTLRPFPKVVETWFADRVDAAALRSSGIVAVRSLRQVRSVPSEEVRARAEVVEFHTLLTDLTADEDALWSAVQKKTRGYIRRAGEVPHAISRVSSDPEGSLKQFVETFRAAKDLGSTPSPVYDLYLANGFASTLSVAESPIVAHVYVVDPALRRSRLLWSARALETTLDTSSLNKLLHWEDIRYAKHELGLRTYDWGGVALTEGALRGVDEFKMKFGGELVTEYNVAWRSPLYGWASSARRRVRGQRRSA